VTIGRMRLPSFCLHGPGALFERAVDMPRCGQPCGEMIAILSAVTRGVHCACGVQAVYQADNSGWTMLSTGVEKIVDNVIGLLPKCQKEP